MEEDIKNISNYSIKELRKICQATAPNPLRESFVGKISRIFSIYTTKFFILINVSPAIISLLSLVSFFVGIVLFSFGGYYVGIAGSLIVFVSIIFDGSDGEVARALKKTSKFGGLYLEPLTHDLQYGLAFLVVSIGIYNLGYGYIFIILGAVAGISKLIYRILEIRFWFFRSDNSNVNIDDINKEYKNKNFFVKFAYWVNKNFLSSTGVFLVMFFCAIFGRIEYFVLFFAFGNFIFLVALLTKQILYFHKQNIYEN